MQAAGIELVTPDKHRLGERPPQEVAKARIHLVVESVFATLERQMHLAKISPAPPAASHRWMAAALGRLRCPRLD